MTKKVLISWIMLDFQALTLVGPTREDPVLDPLAVLHLDNRLYMSRKGTQSVNR